MKCNSVILKRIYIVFFAAAVMFSSAACTPAVPGEPVTENEKKQSEISDTENVKKHDPLDTSDYMDEPVTLDVNYLKERLPDDNVSVNFYDGTAGVYSLDYTFSKAGDNIAIQAALFAEGGRRFSDFYLIDGEAYLNRKDGFSDDTPEIIYHCPYKTDYETVKEMTGKLGLDFVTPVRDDYEEIYMYRSNEDEDTISATAAPPDDTIDRFIIDKETDTIKSVRVMEDHNDIKGIKIKLIQEISISELPEGVQEMTLEEMLDCVSEELLRYTAAINHNMIYKWQPWDFKPVPGV